MVLIAVGELLFAQGGDITVEEKMYINIYTDFLIELTLLSSITRTRRASGKTSKSVLEVGLESVQLANGDRRIHFKSVHARSGHGCHGVSL